MTNPRLTPVLLIAVVYVLLLALHSCKPQDPALRTKKELIKGSKSPSTVTATQVTPLV